MACRLVTPSHYLNQCWIIVNLTRRDKLHWKLNRNLNIFIQQNALENVFWKMAVMLFGLNVFRRFCGIYIRANSLLFSIMSLNISTISPRGNALMSALISTLTCSCEGAPARPSINCLACPIASLDDHHIRGMSSICISYYCHYAVNLPYAKYPLEWRHMAAMASQITSNATFWLKHLVRASLKS